MCVWQEARLIQWLPHVGPGTPLPPWSIYFLIFSPFYFSLSFIGFTYFLLLSIPSLSTRIVPLRFQAGGRRRRPNLGLVCVLWCNLCYLYSLVKTDSGVLFYLVWFSFFVFLQCFDTVGWVMWPVKTRPRYDLECVWWDVKPYSINQSINQSDTVASLRLVSPGGQLMVCHPILSSKNWRPFQ